MLNKADDLKKTTILQFTRVCARTHNSFARAHVNELKYYCINFWTASEGEKMTAPIKRHAPECAYWLDQYPWECTCGLTAPRQPWQPRHAPTRPALEPTP